MDIAIISPGQFAAASEKASSVERVADEMARRLPDRCKVTIYSRRLDDAEPRERIGSLEHRRIRAISRASYRGQIVRALRRQPPDLLQIENRPFLAKQFRRLFPSLPIILSLHSTTFVNPRIYGRRALQSCFDNVERIVVNSEFLARWLQERFKLTSRKLHICYPGVDVSRFASKHTPEGLEQGEGLREELGYQDKKIILFMGRLVPLKGVHHLLSALPAVRAEHDDVVLIICGSARYGSDEVTPYVRRLHMMGNRMPLHVRFIPYVPHSQVPAWYQAADIAAVPSAREEAFGLVNIEALACATPVVATRSGGIPEIVRHDEHGLLIEPSQIEQQLAEALIRLLHDAERRSRLGRQGAWHVREHFTWQRTAERYCELYDSLLRATRRRRSRQISRPN